FRAVAGFGSHKLRYIFLPMSWKGSSDIQRNIVFGGETYTVGSTVSGDLTIDYHRLGYEYDIIDTLDNKLGIIFEVKYLDIVGSLQEPLIPLDEKGEIALPIPTVGLTFQIGLPSFFTVGAEVTGMSAGQYGRIIDAEAAINFAPVPFFRLSGGYKILNVHGEYQDNVVDLSIKGPFAMLRFKF
ncbi:MAG: hypothetical protein KAR06_01965, partial [Deltaproteobacteria bacterium]|nr:hypothetical protein [Deltaproteobacteria bacterium]